MYKCCSKGIKHLISIIAVLILSSPFLSGCKGEEPPQELILATTTSTYDSGLLDAIIPDFESDYNATVSVVAVGTGQAIAMGEAGDADVLLVHARSKEEAFVEAGYGTHRYDVMYNDFILVGPTDDPAGVGEVDTAAEALTRIAEAEAPFISRGDSSGTHARELQLWEAAGITPEGDWYQAAGQGMGAVLTMADEQMAYTLSDRATYLARREEGISLIIVLESDEALFNPYSVIPVNPEVHPHVNYDLAMSFVEWLRSAETQEAIGAYTKFGEVLFVPDAGEN